jgi:hypothetical protein
MKIIQEIEDKVASVQVHGSILSLKTFEGIQKTFILNESATDDESLHTWLMNNSKGYMEKFSAELKLKLESLKG